MPDMDSVFVMEKDSLIIDRLDVNLAFNADCVMAEAISRASIYCDAVKQYRSNSYIIGKLTLDNIHSWVDKVSHKLDNIFLSDYKDRTMFQELYNITEYIHPNM